MKPFEAIDFYRLDELLSEDERQVRDTVRAFVTDRVLPIIERHNRAGTFPMELVPGMAELGLLGANIEGFGCAGLGAVAYGLIMQELERGDSGLRSFVSVQGSLVMHPIHRFGSGSQKERWLPALAAGKAIGCFGLTEADAGSDPSSIRTRARKVDGGWMLSGSKMWITNGSIADVAVVWALTDDGVRGFLVEKGTPGYTSRDIQGKFALRASVTSELVFEDCRLSEEALLPGAEGFKAAFSCLNQARYGIAWGAVGSAMAVFDEVRRFASARIMFGKPIASFQLVQDKLVKMLTEITKAQLVAWRLGKLKEAEKATPQQISFAKRNNVEVALDIARLGRDLLGASGTADEYQTGRHMCNLEAVKTYEGTHDIHTLILGEWITERPAFR
ncbi:MAG: acyl-CoA dehydrogenase family protein [Acidobacteriota bacterium]